jgi:cation transport ATPase
LRVIKQNLFWALGYNSIAALGKLNPMIASAAMTLISISVVLNSLRFSVNRETRQALSFPLYFIKSGMII